jgi:preprotein translocase subunit SecD
VKKRFAEVDQVKEDRLKAFGAAIFDLLAPTEAAASEASIESWIKQRAWNEMLERARARWPFLQNFKAEMERIPADNVEELVSFIQAKGVVIGQAAIAALEPILGPEAFKLEYQVKQGEKKDGKDDSKKKKEEEEEFKEDSAESITQFVTDNYGPSAHAIRQEIEKLAEQSGRTRDLALEDVQRIKDLVAKVGSLEFRILANNTDDDDGIKDATEALNSPQMAEELEKRAKAGLPPPPPKNQEFWTITLPRGVTSKVTYSWVELGPQERKQLNLDNAARNDAERNYVWLEAQRNKNKATLLHDRTQRPLLQGALFYTRECKDTNLPEEERRLKEFEYFVLTREPEIDPNDPTNRKRLPKIDGSYLIAARRDQGNDFRPAVSFVFNNEGGELFGDITRKNVPSGAGAEADQIRRHLAIILDGLVMSAPTINSEIRTHGQISGSFTAKEVDALVNILRAGRLPRSAVWMTLWPSPGAKASYSLHSAI